MSISQPTSRINLGREVFPSLREVQRWLGTLFYLLAWQPSPVSVRSRPCPPRVPSLVLSVTLFTGFRGALSPPLPHLQSWALDGRGRPDTFPFCSSPRAPCAGRGYFRGIYQGQRVQHHELVSWGGVGHGGGRMAPQTLPPPWKVRAGWAPVSELRMLRPGESRGRGSWRPGGSPLPPVRWLLLAVGRRLERNRPRAIGAPVSSAA